MGLSHPQRLQLRRLRRASVRGPQSAAALGGAVFLAGEGAMEVAVAVGLVGVALLVDGAQALRGATRSGIGADSEARVRRALDALRAEDWRVEHGVSWPGGGDIDHVAESPGGARFAIETKTRRYSRAQLERTAATARWLGRRRRGARVVAVLCVVRDGRRPAVEHGVVVVSLGDLPHMLRALAVSRGGRRAGSHVRRRASVGRAVARW
jgi:hypothetical protein